MAKQKRAEEWPKDKLTALILLAKDGYSAREIGERLGYSKNSVLGKAHRNKIEVGLTSAAGFLQSQRFGRKGKMLDEDLPPRQPLPDRGLCQWPLGDVWCGCKTDDIYCPEHFLLSRSGKTNLTPGEIAALSALY